MDLLEFPIQVVQDLVHAKHEQLIPKGSVDALQACMRHGLLGASCYTGVGACEIGSRNLQMATEMMGMMQPMMQPPHPAFPWHPQLHMMLNMMMQPAKCQPASLQANFAEID